MEAGAEYAISALRQGEIDRDESEGGWAIRTRFYDASGQPINTETLATKRNDAASDWERKGGTAVAPTNAATLKVELAVEQISS